MAPLGGTVLTVLVLVALLLLSAFFSSSETAIFSLTDQWLSEQSAADDRRIQTLRDLRSDPHRLLVTILVGNNVVNVAIASATTALLLEFFPTGSAVSLATLVTSFVVLIFGEIVPKSYGLGHATDWAPRVAGPLAVVERVIFPLVVLFDRITRQLNASLGGETEIEKPYTEK